MLSNGINLLLQDKNGQRPDMMSVNPEARAALRDARLAVREYAVGDNASRVRQQTCVAAVFVISLVILHNSIPWMGSMCHFETSICHKRSYDPPVARRSDNERGRPGFTPAF